ncbi:hypothetical protein RJ639_021744 [Escallonia herrerae]|uniref:Pentatricopeptide repeat-containing protein n=1 Tax=Escallonia herrerae TaxID=1293975 RepID=A0AA89AGB6_9ASTE|nr:hypothetical protein RJ639_021744 [Escallonia herrerae]
MKFTCYRDKVTAITGSPAQQLYKLNCLLAELTRSHNSFNAFQIFLEIHSSYHLDPDHYTVSTILAACANLRTTVVGNQLHAHAIRAGLKAFPHVTNALLSMYAKAEDLVSVNRVFAEIDKPDAYSWTTLLSACTKLGDAGYACNLLDQMPHGNVVVWNAIITGSAENGHAGIAFDLFKRMHLLGVRHDNYTFASVLTLCTVELLDFGRVIHSLVIKTGYLVRTSVWNALLTMYFNCESVTDAYEVFEETAANGHDQITYNAMIAGLVSGGRDVEAFFMFKYMQEVCLRPNELTFASIMSSCACARVAIQVHAQVIKIGFSNCTSVNNAAITMYSICGDLLAADMIFRSLEEKDRVSWNTMITSYAQGNLARAAIMTFLQMQREGIEPDEFTIGSLLTSSELLLNTEIIKRLAGSTKIFILDCLSLGHFQEQT